MASGRATCAMGKFAARPHKHWQLTESLVSLAVPSAGNCPQGPEARKHANCVLLHSQRRIQHGKRRSPSIAVLWGFSPAYRQAPVIGMLASTRAKAKAQGGGRGLNVRPGRSDRPASNDASKNPVPAANDASDGGKRDAANEQNELNDNTNKSPVEPSPAARNLQQDADAGVKTAIDLVWNDLSPAATTSAGDANLGSRIHLKQLGITAKDWSKGITQRQDIANKLITNVCQVSNTPARDRLLMSLGGLGFIGRANTTLSTFRRGPEQPKKPVSASARARKLLKI